MKIILMGTSWWVIPVFDRIALDHDVVAVFTRAPKPAGRKKIITKSPVHVWAESHGIPVYTNINDLTNPENNIAQPDFIIVASYGVILKQPALEFAKRGIINIHPSLLPLYRGPSPMLTSIYNGDSESGVCLMNMVAAVDAGDIYMCRKFDIGENDTIGVVEEKVGKIAADMIVDYFKDPLSYPARQQSGAPSFSRKFTGQDEVIDWKRNAFDIHNQVRSIGGRTKINGHDVKILETRLSDSNGGTPACGLEILRVQPAGKNPMSWRDFLNGVRGNLEFE